MQPVPSTADAASTSCQKRTWKAWAMLGGILSGLVILWLGIWPAITRQPAIARYIQQNREQGIDPAAKFYTELEATAAGRVHVQSAQRRDPFAWWKPALMQPKPVTSPDQGPDSGQENQGR